MRLNSFTRLLALLLCIALLGSAAIAQTSKGTVTGNVTDPTGAVVSGATVTLTNVATNVVRTTESTAAGLYRFDAVDLGDYKISVSASGFATSEVRGIPVRANQNSAVDFTMKVGSKEQVVEVQAAGAMVTLQTEEQLRGANIDTRAIRDLPVSSQDTLSLLTTVPGIVPASNGVDNQGYGSVNGSRARANNFMIDGVDNNDISVAGPAIVMYNNDAIQEVSIQTANFSAEFGRSGGAVINQVTKSGTNNFHGTAAWVYRSEVFNATTRDEKKNYLNGLTDSPKAKFLEQIPAFTVGGPIIKDKLFFFTAGQWDRYNSGSAQYPFTVPTAAGNQVLQSLASSCPNVALYLQALNGAQAATSTGSVDISIPALQYTAAQPTCNGTNRAGMKVEYGLAPRIVSILVPAYNFQSRVDWTLSQKQNLSFRFWKDNTSQPMYSVGISRPFDADLQTTNYIGGITHTYVLNNTTTNELRLNYVRIGPIWNVVDSTGLGSLPVFSYGNLSAFGTATNQPQGRKANTYQLQDAMSKIIGRHQFRFGGEFFDQIAMQIAPMTIRGTVNYSSSGNLAAGTLVTGFANFIDDYSGTGSNRVTKSFGTPVYHPSYMAGSFFFQDSWKVTPNLTFNYGIRYDYFGQPANIFKYPMANFDTTAFSTERIPVDKNNWGPSIGFAYSPKSGWFSDGKTVIRGGFQVSYDRWFNNLLSNMATGFPNQGAQVPVNCNTTSCIGTNTAPLRGLAGLYSTQFPAMVPAQILPVTSTGQKTDTSSQFTGNIRNPYTERWSLGVQHELPWNMLVDVSYVGSASHKLYQQQQLNPYGTPVLNTDGTYSTGPRLNPNIGARTVRAAGANSNYNSLQVSANKRMSNTPLGGLQFTSAFTWSKALSVIDEVFATYSSNATMMTANPLRYDGNRLWDYGVSDNSRKFRWVSTAVWDVKGPKKGVMGQVAGGWSLSAVFPWQSATPYTVFNGSDRDLDGSAADRPDIGNLSAPINTAATYTTSCSTNWASPSGACVNPTDVRWLFYGTGTYSPTNSNTYRRNSLLTKTGSILMNMNVLKTFNVREGMKFEVRAEIFNLFNHMNYNYVPVNTSVSNFFSGSTAQFLDYSQETDPGHRTMRVGAKFIF